MEKSFYIKITQAFSERMGAKESTINPGSFFGYAVTSLGQYVCANKSMDDFPDDFDTIAPLSVVRLGVDEFPATPPIE